MANILIVDDVDTNREFLSTLLGYRHHRVLEARDGIEALAVVREVRPDLVISDILMPRMDGFEFVQELRLLPELRDVPVFFYTAYYHEREARRLAVACGASEVLIKPAEPEELLAAVDMVLGAPRPEAEPEQHFDRDHLRLVTNKLSQTVEELSRTASRLTTLTEINLQLASERSTDKLLEHLCRYSRDLATAKHAIVGIWDDGSAILREVLLSGFVQQDEAPIREALLAHQPFRSMAERPDAARIADVSAEPAALGLPDAYPRSRSLLIAPLRSLARVYGWVCLTDKLGANEFDAEDERVIATLAAQTGRIYENSILYREVLEHAEDLEAENAARRLAEDRVRRLNRIYAVLSGINALIVRVRNRAQLFNEACRVATDAGGFPCAWIGVPDQQNFRITAMAYSGSDEKLLDIIMKGLSENHLEGVLRQLGTRALVGMKPIFWDDGKTLLDDGPIAELWANGIRSTAVFPLVVSGRSVGVLALHTREPGFFDAEETKLLLEVAGDIGFALNHLEKEESLNYLAYYDLVTGLPNRSLFVERLGRAIATAARSSKRLFVVKGEVKRFRKINEAFGRSGGDEFLKQLGARLLELLDNPENLARGAGDYFSTFLSEDGSFAEIVHRLERLPVNVSAKPLLIGDQAVSFSFCAGASVYPSDGGDPETLLRRAELALEAASKSGENFRFYEPTIQARVAESLKLENKLREALEHQRFVLHYQPKVTAKSREIRSVEALLRWNDPDLGLVLPARFIPVLEETGMIREVGAWALTQAVTDIGRWRALGLDAPRVAVNVSPIQLHEKLFVSVVLNALGSFGESEALLDIELTESVIMENVSQSITALANLRGAGVEIAVDDFGTGYSSLSYLARLPINALKIDISFVQAMVRSGEGALIVEAIISLAHSLRLQVIAEGVETEDQARMLEHLECDQMQGFHFGKPVPFEEISELLGRRR